MAEAPVALTAAERRQLDALLRKLAGAHRLTTPPVD